MVHYSLEERVLSVHVGALAQQRGEITLLNRGSKKMEGI